MARCPMTARAPLPCTLLALVLPPSSLHCFTVGSISDHPSCRCVPSAPPFHLATSMHHARAYIALLAVLCLIVTNLPAAHDWSTIHAACNTHAPPLLREQHVHTIPMHDGCKHSQKPAHVLRLRTRHVCMRSTIATVLLPACAAPFNRWRRGLPAARSR